MRTKEEALRACPTCGAKDMDMGLRDYETWVNAALPGKAGATDFDCVVERRGHFIMFEFKPNKYVPRGQAIMFDALYDQGWDILVVVDKDLKQGKLEVSLWKDPSWYTMSPSELKDLARRWYDEASTQARGSGSKHLPAVRECLARVGPAVGTRQARAIRGMAGNR